MTAETSRSLPAHFPPVLYLPTAAPADNGADARLEYRRAADGRSVLLAYSALDRLVEGMGDQQSWIVMATASLEAVWEADRFDMVLLDVRVPDEARLGAVSTESGS